MITFEITSGQLRADGILLGTGYAGNGSALNNPLATDIKMHGPLPVGSYAIGFPQDRPTTGRFSLPLTPDSANQMFGRSEFYIHGGLANEPCDSPSVTPGGQRTASDGCIVTAHDVRVAISQDPDHLLHVVAVDPDATPQVA